MAFNPMMIPRMGGMQLPFGGGANPGFAMPQMGGMQQPSLAGKFDPQAFMAQANAQNAARMQAQQQQQDVAKTIKPPYYQPVPGLPFGMGGTISSVLNSFQFPQQSYS